MLGRRDGEDEGRGHCCAAEEGKDADYAVVGVVVCVLEDAGEDAHDTRHAEGKSGNVFALQEGGGVEVTYALLIVIFMPYAEPKTDWCHIDVLIESMMVVGPREKAKA